MQQVTLTYKNKNRIIRLTKSEKINFYKQVIIKLWINLPAGSQFKILCAMPNVTIS